ncbi:MAG: archease [candidate division KSB1 bacterium]|nr:archease [candidate division KSB1 bacterium]MDZ7276557.1 archease [candidate division KSB1 bacterium]MDZ7285024.1 archease [candidate division KSB1 bacterium]MDZ7298056.1 archease [candidate division KSB1 bacterium]MDZ7307444.1 archease [candidate division KSB1 bacterium]
MSIPSSGFEPIDHTADVGYRLYAATLPELFIVAARALFDAITDLETIRPVLARTISVTASDVEALLVAWLAELNFHCLTGLEVFSQFKIEKFSPTALTALARGERIDLQRHTIKTEIKAVTYHGLHLRETAAGWEAQVIFDV